MCLVWTEGQSKQFARERNSAIWLEEAQRGSEVTDLSSVGGTNGLIKEVSLLVGAPRGSDCEILSLIRTPSAARPQRRVKTVFPYRIFQTTNTLISSSNTSSLHLRPKPQRKSQTGLRLLLVPPHKDSTELYSGVHFPSSSVSFSSSSPTVSVPPSSLSSPKLLSIWKSHSV